MYYYSNYQLRRKSMALLGRANVTLRSFRRCLSVVPMILYPPKVSLERVVDAIETIRR